MRGIPARALLLITGILLPLTAHAYAPCVVHLDPSGGPEPWQHAVASAARNVAASDGGDCADILVTPEREGAIVTFTTRDGRMAQRHIHRPSDLAPLVDALTVTVPLAAPRAAAEVEAPAPTETAPEATLPVDSTSPGGMRIEADRPSAKPARPVFVVVFAGGGARTSGPADAVAPQGQVGIGVVVREWQFDVVGRLEAEHDLFDDGRMHVEASSLGGGVRASRRTRVGPLVIVTGASLAVQYASIEAHRAARQHLENDWVEPRAGAFVGVVGPRVGRFRLRGEVLGEVALARHDATTSIPASAGWGVGAMVGVETWLLP